MTVADIIERIAYFRIQKGMSARELSLQIGKHEGYINKLESASFNLPTDVLLDILECLQVPARKFFADNYKTYEVDEEFYSRIKKLPYNNRTSLLNFIKSI